MKYIKNMPFYDTTRKRSVFCFLPRTYLLGNLNDQRKQKITFWLEKIEICEKYTKGRYGNFWITIEVNGMKIVYR